MTPEQAALYKSLGTIEATLKSNKDILEKNTGRLQDLDRRILRIEGVFRQASGGWKILIAVLSGFAALVAGVIYIVEHVRNWF